MKYEVRATLRDGNEILDEFVQAFAACEEAERQAARGYECGYDVDVVSIEDERP